MSDAAPHLFAPTYGRATSVFAGAPITGSQLIIRRENGVETPLLAHAAPLREESGAITSAVVAFQDVTAFLDMSRIQAGQLQLDLRRAALWPMVERLLSQQRATTLDHQFQLSPFPPEQRAEIAGRWDARRVEQILMNLLSNAVKYSPSGGLIAVSVEPMPEGYIPETRLPGRPR